MISDIQSHALQILVGNQTSTIIFPNFIRQQTIMINITEMEQSKNRLIVKSISSNINLNFI